MLENFLSVINWVLIIAVFILIILDIVAGIAKAAVEKNIQSGYMFTGLLKKSAYIIVIVLAAVIDWLALYIELPFQTHIFIAACVFIILIEVASILENVTVINPALKNNAFLDLFGVKKEDEEFESEEIKNDAIRD